jgi:hypothetical protein
VVIHPPPGPVTNERRPAVLPVGTILGFSQRFAAVGSIADLKLSGRAAKRPGPRSQGMRCNPCDRATTDLGASHCPAAVFDLNRQAGA